MVVIIYSKSCGSSRVDETRHHLFSIGTKSLENLPPTQAALQSAHQKSIAEGQLLLESGN